MQNKFSILWNHETIWNPYEIGTILYKPENQGCDDRTFVQTFVKSVLGLPLQLRFGASSPALSSPFGSNWISQTCPNLMPPKTATNMLMIQNRVIEIGFDILNHILKKLDTRLPTSENCLGIKHLNYWWINSDLLQWYLPLPFSQGMSTVLAPQWIHHPHCHTATMVPCRIWGPNISVLQGWTSRKMHVLWQFECRP